MLHQSAMFYDDPVFICEENHICSKLIFTDIYSAVTLRGFISLYRININANVCVCECVFVERKGVGYKDTEADRKRSSQCYHGWG